MQIRMEELLAIVKEAGELLFDRKEASRVTVKGVADYVTQVDFHVQEFIRTRLESKWPEVQFMGEEKDNSGLDFSKAVWILDPVDGTTNLIHGFMHSAISLALCEQGRISCGVVYLPFTKECFYAQRGKGAYRDGERIHVSEAASMQDSLISIGTAPYAHEYADENFKLFKRIFLDCQDIRRLGSAAIDLAYVASGRLDAYFERELKPWDFAAGLLLVEEAGGTVTDFEGNDVTVWQKGSILGSNGKIGAILAEQYMKGF